MKCGQVQDGRVFQLRILFTQELGGIERIPSKHCLIPAGCRVIRIFRISGGGQQRSVLAKVLRAVDPRQSLQYFKRGDRVDGSAKGDSLMSTSSSSLAIDIGPSGVGLAYGESRQPIFPDELPGKYKVTLRVVAGSFGSLFAVAGVWIRCIARK